MWGLCVCWQDRLVGKRTEKLRFQTDLQKLQNYRCTLEAHKTGLENKAAGLAEELQAAGERLQDADTNALTL